MQVYFFTRSGRSERIANELAARYHVQPIRIEDSQNWSGFFGYMKAGYMAAKGKSLPATYHAPEDGDQIILVFPLWAGSFPPAVRTFLHEVGRDRIICIPTSLGSTLKDRSGFCKVIDLVGHEITAPEVI